MLGVDLGTKDYSLKMCGDVLHNSVSKLKNCMKYLTHADSIIVVRG